MPIRIFGLTI